MASGPEMMLNSLLPMLQKVIPAHVWEVVQGRVLNMASEISAAREAQIRIEAKQDEILALLRPAPQSTYIVHPDSIEEVPHVTNGQGRA